MKETNRHILTISFLFGLLLSLAISQSSCNAPAGVIEEPSFRPCAFKLTENPSAFISGDAGYFDRLLGEFTLGADTRKAFRMGEAQSLMFSIDAPAEGKLRFAYCHNPEAYKYGEEFKLTGSIDSGDESIELGEVALRPQKSRGQAGWSSAEWDIPEGVSGKSLLFFKLEGLKADAPPDVFHLAHPTIIDLAAQREPTRIIWVAVDTLRADHLGCYGYERPTSTDIDAFAKDATLFERCIATSPWTYPSFGAMFTGRYPSIAGAVTNVKSLPDDELVIAEILSRRGFATLSVVNSPWVGPTTNLHQGFDVCYEYPYKRAKVSFDHALNWLKRHAGEDAFVFIHLMDTHLPYRPKGTNAGLFGPDGYSGPFEKEFDMTPDEIEALREGLIDLPDTDKHRIEALYDEEILGFDQDFGAFLGELRECGVYDGAMVIFTSDHGEEFWEHGGYEHGHQLYDEVLHVPLIIKGAGFPAGKRIDGLCSNIDVLPTILEWLGFDIPGEINAINLQDLMLGASEPGGRHLISEELYYGVEQKSVSTDGYRYIFHTLDSSEELYDCTDDPGMLMDVANDRRAMARQFRYLLKEYILNGMSGWHMRFSSNPSMGRGKYYEVTVSAQGGFPYFEGYGFDEGDLLTMEGEALIAKVRIHVDEEKTVSFSTLNEDVDVAFSVEIDGAHKYQGLIYLGPNKQVAGCNEFSLKITDARFGLGIPNFRDGQDPGVYIWGNAESLREGLSPEISDEVMEELKSLGYLQ